MFPTRHDTFFGRCLHTLPRVFYAQLGGITVSSFKWVKLRLCQHFSKTYIYIFSPGFPTRCFFVLWHELLAPHTVYTLVWGLLINLLGPKFSIRVLFHPYNYPWTRSTLNPSFILCIKFGWRPRSKFFYYTGLALWSSSRALLGCQFHCWQQWTNLALSNHGSPLDRIIDLVLRSH